MINVPTPATTDVRVERFIATIGFLLWTAVPAPLLAQSVTATNALVKIRPSAPPASDTAVVLKAARNEFEAAQLIVTGPVSGVSVSASRLLGPRGAQIPPQNIRLYRVAYVDVVTPSNIEGSTGLWPDGLIPDVDETANEKRNAFPFSVPTGENRVVWFEVHVPQNQRPGVYRGSLTVTGTGLGSGVNVPVALTVWDFDLPSTRSLASTFGMGWSSACVAHNGSYEACGSDAGVERTHLMYARFLLDHGITADVVYTGPTGCSGPDCNWTHFDATYGALFDGTDPALRLAGARPTSIRYIWGETPEKYAAWAQHFRSKGWFDRTYAYICDEPPAGCAWSDIITRANTVHGADVEFRTLTTTNIDDANANGVTSSINILSPVVNHVHDKPGSQFTGNQRPDYDGFLAGNDRNLLWWYQSCMSHGCSIVGGSYFSGWPNLMIDTSAVQNRAQGILSWLYGVTGILYYRIDERLPQAWDANGLYAFGGNGDGTLVYPGKPSIIGGSTHIPLASIRLKALRDGFEDYELMKLVTDLGDPVFATQVGQNLFQNLFSSAQPAGSVYATREALAERILVLRGQSPDLSVTAVSAPANAIRGRAMIVADRTTNIGAARATEPTRTRYYLSLDSTLDGSDMPLGGGRAVPDLAAGASAVGARSVRIPLGIAPGAYFLIAQADDTSVLAESRENNNSTARALTVQ